MNKNGSSVAEEPKVSVTEKSNALEDGKSNGLPEMNKNGSSAAEKHKGSETAKTVEMVASQVIGIVSKTTLDGDGVPTSSSVMEDEKMEGASEKSPHGILAAVDESRSSKIENSHPMAESEVDGIGPEASLIPEGSEMSEVAIDGRIQHVDSLIASMDSKGSEVEVGDEVSHSEAGGIVPEKVSADTGFPSSSLVIQDETTEDPPGKDTVSTSVAGEKSQ
ncbi:hypothetical protein GH714_002396 [Hevea brasiliensis]|uniref:Uncharacterized protein n=1 Tax=Hevea brasiliensis TaxID=3981 RepID=A0A6A6KFZ9_HEVBR|nr:hypothetical protein GH714_002396 [Hevea brasiliensis]